MKTVENYGTHFGWALRRGRTPAEKMWRQNPEQARVKTTTENEKDTVKVCVSSLSFHGGLFLSAYHKAVDSFFKLSFSFLDDY